MTLSKIGDIYFLTHCTLPIDMIKVGSRWISSSNSIVTVVSIDNSEWVKYEWMGSDGTVKQHEKESFAFQCRYSLIVEKNEFLWK